VDPTTFATAYGLSAGIGIRPFLTLALASIAMHFGYLHPSHAFAFLHSDGATMLLAVLAALEFAADKVPVVDHALHVFHFALKPVAAALLVDSTVSGSGAPDLASYAMMGVGALTAMGVHTGIATVRSASSATTLGVANPFVSLFEDVVAIVAALVAILVPLAGAVLAFVLSVVAMFVAVRLIGAAQRARGSTIATS